MGAGSRTVLLMGALTALLLVIGYIVGLLIGIPITYAVSAAFIVAMVMNLFSYWYADKWVLKLYRAKIVGEHEQPELHAIVERLAANAGLPKPKVAIVPSDVPNAFATGRSPSNAVVAVTNGAMKVLNKEELEGVLGHEIAHIKNRDMLVSTIAAMIAGAIAWLALIGRFGVFYGGERDRRGNAGSAILALLALILVPIAATLIRLSVSRAREYGADEEGARISRKPLALASALKTLESVVRQRPMREGNPSTSHMFIVNPFRGDRIVELFSTHPLTEKRIQRLEEMARTGRF
jgi:heat shock protein HtpX